MTTVSATRLQSAIEAVVSARAHGRDAILAAAASHPMVVEPEVRVDGEGVWLIVLKLRAAEAPTLDEWTKLVGAPVGGPQMVSPSNVPPERWGELPLGWDFPRSWGKLHVSHAHGDAEQRLTRAILNFTKRA